MSYDKIIVERDGPLAIVTLNDPARLNAINLSMLQELAAAMGDVLGDGSVRAVLITGAGRAFCSGADLVAVSNDEAAGAAPEVGAMLRDVLNPLLQGMRESEKPIVCAVNGAAAGVGCGLALAADVVLVARSGYFLQAFIRVGLVPDGGASWMLPRLAGAGRAMAMMMLGQKVAAQEAVAWGLAYQWYEDDDLALAARGLAMDLAKGPTRAYGQLKRMLAASAANSFAEQLELEASNQEHAAASVDFKEGVAAFVGKRRANFTGA